MIVTQLFRWKAFLASILLVLFGMSHSFAADVATPVLQLEAGATSTQFNVRVTDATPNAVIRYRTDGADPTASDPTVVSGGVVAVSSNVIFKAKAWDGATPVALTPSAVATEVYNVFGRVAAGEMLTFALKFDGRLLGVGYNNYGGLGDGTSTSRQAPVPVMQSATVNDTMRNVISVEGGQSGGTYDHTVAAKSDGTAWAWGYNGYGQLGNGGTTWSAYPVQVLKAASQPLTGVVMVAGAYYSSFALCADGTVWSWGYNGYGELGEGTTTGRSYSGQVKINTSTPLTGIIAIAAGDYHLLALDNAGKVWTVGNNATGQLGDGSATNRSYAVKVQASAGVDFSGAVCVAGNSNGAIAVKADGSVWGWGQNDYGQLGDGTATQRNYPVQMKADASNNFAGAQRVAGAYKRMIILKADGSVWAVGYNGYGELGDGTLAARTYPVQVRKDASNYLTGIVDVAAGGNHNAALDSTGKVFTWGYAGYGQLGNGATSSPTYTYATAYSQWPSQAYVQTSLNLVVTSNSTTDPGAFLLSATPVDPQADIARVEFYQGSTLLGTVTSGPWQLSVTGASLSQQFTAVAYSASGLASQVVSAGPPVSTPGLQLETGPTPTQFNVRVTVATPNAVIRYRTDGAEPTTSDPTVASGGTVTVSSNVIFKARAWDGNTPVVMDPSAVAMATYNVFGRVAAGDQESYALRFDGRLSGAGYNYSGALGDGTATMRNAPVAVVHSATLNDILRNAISVDGGQAAVTGYYDHTVAVKSDGSVWAWGYNGYGGLGIGTTTGSNYPVRVLKAAAQPLTNATMVAAGNYVGYALSADGTIWAWGYNGTGELGDGSTTQRNFAVQVKTDSATVLGGIIAIAAGDNHLLALDKTGKVWACGLNTTNQLGDGTTTNRSYAVKVQASTGLDLSGVVGIAATSKGGVAVKGDGSVWSWGNNAAGQLGDGTMTVRPYPVRMKADASNDFAGAQSVAGGSSHVFIMKTDGTLWAVGLNANGQLGDGTTTNRSYPVQVKKSAGVNLTNVASVAGGANHSIALDSSGTVYTWGSAGNGQLGNGATTSPTSSYATAYSQWPSQAYVQTSLNLVVTSTSTTDPGAFLLSATPVDPLADIARVEFYQGSTLLGTVTSGPWQLSVTGASLGQQFTAIAYSTSGLASQVVSAGPPVSTPGLQLETGPTPTQFNVRVTVATPNAVIRYRTDGAEPTTSDPTVASGGTVTVSSNVIFKARAWDGNTPVIMNPSKVATAVYNVFGKVVTGDQETYALKFDGRMASVGYNYGGQLGDGTTTTRTSPVSVLKSAAANDFLRNVVWMDAGQTGGAGYYDQMIVAKSDGTAWSWGWSANYGGLGNGSTLRSNYPVPVLKADGQPLTGVVMTASGYYAGYALCEDGTVWAWGNNEFGNLGDGSTTSTTYAHQVYLNATTPLTGIIAISASNHLLALDNTGKVWSWGYNNYGQLGDGSATTRNFPVRVQASAGVDLTGVTSIATTYSSSMAVKNDGSVWSWGYNSSSQLGDGTQTQRNYPVQVKADASNFFAGAQSVTGGSSNHVFILKADDTLWGVGLNGNGQLGDGTLTNRSYPVQVKKNASTYLTNVVSVSAGFSHSSALDNTGTVYTWGANGNGQLGNGSTTPATYATAFSQWASQAYVQTSLNLAVTSTSPADPGTFLLSATPVDPSADIARVEFYQGGVLLGTVTSGPWQWTVTGAALNQSFSAIAYSTTGLVSLVATAPPRITTPTLQIQEGLAPGQYEVWISDATPDAVIRFTTNGREPTESDGTIESGSSVTITGNTIFKAKAWDGNTPAYLAPSAVVTQIYNIVGKVAAGEYESFGLKFDGQIVATGHNYAGAVGDGTTATKYTPVAVVRSAMVNDLLKNAISVEGGQYDTNAYDHTLAAKRDGTVWAWGYNNVGQLGNGTSTSSAYPVQALKGPSQPLTNVMMVAAGFAASYALDTDGTVWAWGYNSYGELGDGGTTGRNYAVPVRESAGTVLSGVVAIAAGEYHFLALKGDGSVWAVGYNAYGQLGDGSTAQANYAVRVKTGASTYLTGVASIAAGLKMSVAVKEDGTVWSWGDNTNGQLGTGNTTASVYAVQMKAGAGTYFSDAQSVACGPKAVMVIKADGTLWGVGFNGNGQLGNGTTADTSYPIAVRTNANTVLKDVSSVACGLAHTIASDKFGRVFTWGGDSYGQLGNGASSSPTSTFATAYSQWPSLMSKVLPLNLALSSSTSPKPGSFTMTATSADPTLTGTITRVDFYNGGQYLGSDSSSPWQWSISDLGAGNYTFNAIAYDTNGVAGATASVVGAVVEPASSEIVSTRYSRGTGTDPNYLSFLVAVDFEKGVLLDAIGNNFDKFEAADDDVTKLPWFLRTQKETVHLIGNNAGTINYSASAENALAAFGSQSGGSPLYTGQSYSFGVGSDVQKVRISAYDKSSFASGATGVTPSGTVSGIPTVVPGNAVITQGSPTASEWVLELPKPGTAAWHEFATNGFMQEVDLKTVTVNGKAVLFKAKIQKMAGYTPASTWGQTASYPVLISVTSETTDFYFKCSVMGFSAKLVGTDTVEQYWMATTDSANTHPYYSYNKTTGASIPVTDPNNSPAYSASFTLDFDVRPPWRSIYLDQPHFSGIPLPSQYQGKSVDELLRNAPLVTDTLTAPAASLLNIDDSPELRRHPILDQFVADMDGERNPLGLVDYVLNEIELTDAMGYSETGPLDEDAVNGSGVNRGALATLLEGQGSPAEQCALTVYLLRQAKVKCGYVFGAHNGLLMFDQQLSKLLQMQLRNAPDVLGNSNVPYLIPVNYPWVAAYIDGRWVHIFPWMKDTAVEEGYDLYKYLPDEYNSGRKWLKKYLLNDPAIRDLGKTGGVVEHDEAGFLFPAFIKKSLAQNHPNLSIDQMGVSIYNRKNWHTRWEDLPRPWQAPTVSNADFKENLAAVQDIFDTVSVVVYSDKNKNGYADNELGLNVQNLRTLDLHNRRLLVYSEKTGADTHKLNLVLEPFRPGTSATGSFSVTGALLDRQLYWMPLDSGDDQLGCYLIYKRHRKVTRPSTAVDHFTPFLGFSEALEFADQRFLRKGDMTAVVLNFGRVTPSMMNVHTRKYWDLQQQQLQPSPPVVSIEDSAGLPVYLMGMSYYANISRSYQQFQALTKSRMLSLSAHGFAKLGAERTSTGALPNSGDINLIYPKLDMAYQLVAWAGNGTLHPDSGNAPNANDSNWLPIVVADVSAQEHRTINRFFRTTDSVSTVRLLDIAQGTVPGSGVVELTSQNVTSMGDTEFTVDGDVKKLKDWAGPLWSSVLAAFDRWDGKFVHIYITPGPQTGAGGVYKGMGVYIDGLGSNAALIGDNAITSNGGFGPPIQGGIPSIQNGSFVEKGDGLEFSSTNTPSYASQATNYGNIGSTLNGISGGTITVLPQQIQMYNASASAIGIDPGLFTMKQVIQYVLNSGAYRIANGGSPTSDWKNKSNLVEDPVNAITGAFYVDAADLVLTGPMPLAIRRNYSSQSLGDSELGYGWKLAYAPYLVQSTDGKTIYATEMDGTTVSYEQQAALPTRWTPTFAKNPHLANSTGEGAGSLTNLFNNRIDMTVVEGVTWYSLTGVDGSVRKFKVRPYQLPGASEVTRLRPYLQEWRDSRGNFYSFTFGEDNTKPNWGQLTRIASSNGNFVSLQYDAYGHITEAFSGDGRRVVYRYDDYGDLVSVVLADGTPVSYEYSHRENATPPAGAPAGSPKGFASDHLLVREVKPNGRILENIYDDATKRRVIEQKATVGPGFDVVTNATFVYTNNFTADPALAGPITGHTVITDIKGGTTRYDYVNSQLTAITDALPQTIAQTWFQEGDGLPGSYPRSLKSRTDARGLLLEYQYDARGNLVEKKATGNLTGNGAGEVALTTSLYNAQNLITEQTDAVNNVTRFTYGVDALQFVPITIEKRTATGSISTTQFAYESVSAGNIPAAYGVLKSVTAAAGTADAATTIYTNDARGFVTSVTKPTGTGDPAVSVSYSFNARGELVTETDAAGQQTSFAYDGRGNRIWTERRDSAGTLVAWQSDYFNRNGQLEWSDGPRYDPEDYVLRRYDGAGRPSEEMRWRSRARLNGTGVEAVPGIDEGVSTTVFKHNGYGDLLEVRDPRRNSTTMTYDAIGRMLNRARHNGAATAPVLSSESFEYEPGGEVSVHTNPLGGVAQSFYTSLGQLKRQENADGSILEWRYDRAGRVVRQILSNLSYWETDYDDLARKVTRTFKSAAGALLASESVSFDRRGNPISTTDREENVFTATYDALNRVKIATGPAATTGSARQSVSHTYDNAGLWHLVTDGLNNRTLIVNDAEGRPVQTKVQSSTGQIVRQSNVSYSPDHHSATFSSGTGSSQIKSTGYTDTFGNTVLVWKAAGQYELSDYDAAGNLLATDNEKREVTSFEYDALNRVVQQSLPAATVNAEASTTFVYDAAGNLLERRMPGGQTHFMTFDSVGRKLTERLEGIQQVQPGTTLSDTGRQFSYGYYTDGANKGLLHTITDQRGVVSTTTYDDYLRPWTVSTTGPDVAHGQSATYAYDRLSRFLTVSTAYADGAAGPATLVEREYDAYSQIKREEVSVDGVLISDFKQTWDAAGRRTALDSQLADIGVGAGRATTFGYRADGLMSHVASGGNTWNFTYDDNGLLKTRTGGGRTQTVTSRDARGRILNQTVSVGAGTPFAEAQTWNDASQRSTYSATRTGVGTWNDNRNYLYNDRGQLFQESANPAAGTTGNFQYRFDFESLASNPPGSGLGVRTAAKWRLGGDADTSQIGSYVTRSPEYAPSLGDPMRWVDAFSRPEAEITTVPTSGNRPVASHYDEIGQLTYRDYYPQGTPNPKEQNQYLTWDGWGRLVSVRDLDDSNSWGNFIWKAVYDGLGRRVRTTKQSLSGGAPTGPIVTIDSQYDPEVEFLEVAVSVDGVRTWEVHGPDLNGVYGGLNGIGGLEATITESTGDVKTAINDTFGNVVGHISDGALVRHSAQVGSYGMLPGSSASTLGGGAPVIETLAWRSRRLDPTGFYYMGARYYDPLAGRFVSPDPLGHGSSMSLYDYCGGDAVNRLDPDGRRDSANSPVIQHLMAGDVELSSFREMMTIPLSGKDAFNFLLSQGKVPLTANSWIKTAQENLMNTDGVDAQLHADNSNRLQARMLLWQQYASPEARDQFRILDALYDLTDVSTLPFDIATTVTPKLVNNVFRIGSIKIRGGNMSLRGRNPESSSLPPSPMENATTVKIRNDLGNDITDIDLIRDGVLWEEKTAGWAGDIDKWVKKSINRKAANYLDARQFFPPYKNAPIGFKFNGLPADPAFQQAVEAAVERLRITYPDVEFRLDWGN